MSALEIMHLKKNVIIKLFKGIIMIIITTIYMALQHGYTDTWVPHKQLWGKP